MFKIREGVGGAPSNFSIKFDNGWTVSLAMGGGTYSTGGFDGGFVSAEVAVVNPDGEFVDQGSGSGVEGWQSESDVVRILNKISAIPSAEESEEMVREIEDTLIRLRLLDLPAAKELAVSNGLVKDEAPTQKGIDFLAAIGGPTND